MSQPLPYSGFKWVDKPPTEPGKGCILEVDLEYPAELHELHNDYPFAPERLKVKKEWLSGYQTNLLEDDDILNTEKLVPHLMDKTKYVLHYRNLQLYLSLGMKLRKSIESWNSMKLPGWNHKSGLTLNSERNPNQHLKKIFFATG